MKNLARLLALAVLCSSLAAALPASAERRDFDEEHHWRRVDRDGDRDRTDHHWRVREDERTHVHDWATRDHERFCRLHDCGRHPIFYAPGAYLPSTVFYEPLPTTVLMPPSGYLYVQTAGGVYLMDRNTRLIADSISLNVTF
jgi:hypothetical protein